MQSRRCRIRRMPEQRRQNDGENRKLERTLPGDQMKRYGMVIGLKPEAEEKYKEHHASVWPAVLEMIHACNIRNYSIYLRDHTLFSYFEYHGTDFAADMARMAADKTTQEWWALVMPMQNPLPGRSPDEWWTAMEEVFHLD
jgi:L-rhamnose mutarotase